MKKMHLKMWSAVVVCCRPVGSNYRLGGHTLQIGGAHINFFKFFFNFFFFFFFFFFWGGGGAYLCKLLGGGGARPSVPPPPYSYGPVLQIIA